MLKTYGIAYVAALVSFLAIDGVWLTLAANPVYRQTLGDILLPSFKIGPAVVFYPIFTIGIVIFAISPALAEGSWRVAVMWGALFGFFSYGLYDFTNMATVRNWDLQLALTDMIWGTVLTGAVAAIGYSAAPYASR